MRKETKNEEKKAFDSDHEEMETDLAEVGLNVEIAYVQENEIIYCNEFHEALEQHLKEREKFNTLHGN